MAEAAAATNIRIGRYDEPKIDFYRQPEVASNIIARAITNTKARIRKRYNRIVQVSYPNRLPYLGVYGTGILALDRFAKDSYPNRWIINKQQVFTTVASKIGSFLAKILPEKIYTKVTSMISKVFGTDATEKTLFIIFSWFGYSMLLRAILKLLLSYENFIFENPRAGYTLRTKLWFIALKIFRGDPKLYSCQNALPSLPIPSIDKTCER